MLGVDLEQSGWPEASTTAGFRREELSAWVAEGFLQYLDEVAVHTLLDAVGTLAAQASRLGADVLSRDFLAHQWMAAYLAELARRGTPWRFGTNEPEALLAGHGWQAAAMQPGEQGANFGRWPWPPAPRDVAGWPRSSWSLRLARPATGNGRDRLRSAHHTAVPSLLFRVICRDTTPESCAGRAAAGSRSLTAAGFGDGRTGHNLQSGS